MSSLQYACINVAVSVILGAGAIAARYTGHPALSVGLLILLTGQAIYLWRRMRDA